MSKRQAAAVIALFAAFFLMIGILWFNIDKEAEKVNEGIHFPPLTTLNR